MRCCFKRAFSVTLILLSIFSCGGNAKKTEGSQGTKVTQEEIDKAVSEAVAKKSAEYEKKIKSLQISIEAAQKGAGKSSETLPGFVEKYADQLATLAEDSQSLADLLKDQCVSIDPIAKEKSDPIQIQITSTLALLDQMKADVMLPANAKFESTTKKIVSQIESLKSLLTWMQALPCLKSKVAPT